MSLNTSHASGGVLIFSGERILIYYDGIEFSLDPDQKRADMKGTKKGRCYLTSHRVIFNNTSKNDPLQSFSIPFVSMREVELEQPVFGANYIKGIVIADGKSWNGRGTFKLVFTKGGAIEFGQAMLTAGKLADKNRRAFVAPPPYEPYMNNYQQAPPPAYTPNDPCYGFVPYQTFPNAPPADSVYMMQAPPPYPGLEPQPANGTNPGWYPGPQINSNNSGYPQNGAPAYPPAYPQNGAPGYAQQNGYPAPYPQTGAPGYPMNGAPGYPTNGAPGYPTNGAPGYPMQYGAPQGYPPEQPPAYSAAAYPTKQ